VQNEYVRWFNRRRGRDGSLVRGRFSSKRVTSTAYRCNLVRYIDFNPVSARLVATPALYPHGSARWYARQKGPPWLSREWVEGIVSSFADREAYDPADYAACHGTALSSSLTRLVERRLASRANLPDPLDNLLSAATAGVRAWMQRKAKLADGTEIGVILCEPEDVESALLSGHDARLPWVILNARKRADAWQVARVGLLRDLCGITFAEIATRTQSSANRTWHLHRLHSQLMQENCDYAQRTADLGSTALRICHVVNTVP